MQQQHEPNQQKKETPYKYYVWMRWLVDVEIFVRILREKFVSNQINYITFGIWYLLILPLVITFEPMQPSHSQPKQNEIMNIARSRAHISYPFLIYERNSFDADSFETHRYISRGAV